MSPYEAVGMVTTWYPTMAAEAGLVPWEESGTMTIFFLFSFALW